MKSGLSMAGASKPIFDPNPSGKDYFQSLRQSSIGGQGPDKDSFAHSTPTRKAEVTHTMQSRRQPSKERIQQK